VLDMKARFAKVLSRLSIVAVVAGSAAGAAACARSQPVDTQPAAVEEAPQAASTSVQGHTPGRHFFKRIDAMDLRPGQRDAMTEIEQNLAADLAPHRETIRQVAATLVAGVEAGRLDPQESAAQRAALVAMVTDAKTTIAGAINEVHDNLDADQRRELVEQLEAERAAHRDVHADPHGDGALARVALEIGLTEEQKQELHDAFKAEMDELFPDRAARREAHEARLNAMAQAFVTDDFDATEFDVAGDVEDGVKAFTVAAEHAIALSGTVLTQGQRAALASLLRDHASKI
jgi:Spy/CpxP family protein refolding chaperone